jgi:PAS domain S-box-containing protein
MCIIDRPFDPQSGTGKQPETQHLLARLKALEEENSLLTNRLLQSESRFRELLEGASDAVLEVSNEGKIQVANNAAVVMFGYAVEELIGQEVETLLVPGAKREGHRHHRQNYSQSPRIRRMGGGLDLSAQKKDGTVFSVEISLLPVWSQEKATVIAIVHDISQRDRKSVV